MRVVAWRLKRSHETRRARTIHRIFPVFSASPLRTATALGLAVFFGLSAAVTPAQAQMALPGSLSVNDSGAAVYMVPIDVPPGTAGMAPKLSLQYSSQSGNGLLGVGWSLSGIPAIARCPQTPTQDGVTHGVNYTTSDRFCLEGERLVAVSGTYGGASTEYRLEREGFSKIVSNGTAGAGPEWFKVWTKSGQIMEFGQTADSRIEVQGSGTARLWTLNKVSDTAGNYWTVTYTEDNSNGDYRPARIDYTGNGGTAPYASVRMTYEARTDITPAYNASAMVTTQLRLTNIKSYVGATLVKDYRLAYGVSASTLKSRLNSITMCDAAGACLPAKNFSWQDITVGFSPVYSSQTGVDYVSWPQARVVSGDWNGDGKTDIAVSNQSLGGIAYYMSNGDGTFTYNFSSQTGTDWISWPGSEIFTGDFNGDGKSDIGVRNNTFISESGYAGGVVVYLSTGSGFVANYVTFSGTGWISHPDARLLVGDWNGDGMTDLAVSKPSFGGIAYYMATGGGNFSAGFGSQTGTDWVSWGNNKVITGDWDGDGRTDIAAYGPSMTGIAYYFSNGNGTFSGGYGAINPAHAWISWPSARVTTGDFNGDGKTDIGMGADGLVGVGVYLSTGTGPFTPVFSLTSGFDYISTPGARTMSGDFNGDGRTDIAVSLPFLGGIAYYLSDITTVKMPSGINNFIFGMSTQTGYDYISWPDSYYLKPLGGDWNGDGKDDLGASGWQVGGIASYLSNPGTGAVPDILTSIDSGPGGTTSISYKTLAQNGNPYTKDTNATYPVVDVQAPIYVVSKVSAPNGVNGTPYDTTYRYVGAKAEVGGRGFLGFRQMIVRDEQTGIEQTTTYRQDWPYLGLAASRSKSTTGVGPIELNKIENVYSAGSALSPSTTPSRYFVSLSNSLEQSKELNGTAMPAVKTSYAYDAYGNATTVTVESGSVAGVTFTGNGYAKTTTNTYGNDLTNWWLGRLTQAIVASTTP